MLDLGIWFADEARAEAAIDWIEALTEDLHIPRLSAYGLTAQAIPQATQAATRASSTRANPVSLSLDEIARILEQAR
jgi:alcohol dehydrogenase class IV